MIIEELITTNDEHIKLKQLKLLVGTNNVGKSRTLTDIYNLIQERTPPTVLIKKLVYSDSLEENMNLVKNLYIENHERDITTVYCSGLRSDLFESAKFIVNLEIPHKRDFIPRNDTERIKEHILKEDLENVLKLNVTFLNTQTRLQLTNKIPAYDTTTQKPKNIVQQLLLDENLQDELNNIFKQAFDYNILLDHTAMTNLYFRISKEMPQLPNNFIEQNKILSKLPNLGEQGDGYRSFVAVILGIIFSRDRLVIIDEPDAFLHPPQARFLGKWLGKYINKMSGQLILATHSSNLLLGLLSSTDDINILRLDRNEQNTKYFTIPNECITNLSKHPILSSQRVIEALFYKGVVVCEGDSDRTIYQTIASIISDNLDILFVHSHTKQTIESVINTLREASIPVIAITDIDILNSERDLNKLIKALTNKELSENHKNIRKIIQEKVDEQTEETIIENVGDSLSSLLDDINKNNADTTKIRRELQKIKKMTSKWKTLKQKGTNYFTGEFKLEVDNLIQEFKELNLYIVPVGELECWIDSIGTNSRNKSEWVVEALNYISNTGIPPDLEKFIRKVLDTFDNMDKPLN